jgi:hypothetical protein
MILLITKSCIRDLFRGKCAEGHTTATKISVSVFVSLAWILEQAIGFNPALLRRRNASEINCPSVSSLKSKSTISEQRQYQSGLFVEVTQY